MSYRNKRSIARLAVMGWLCGLTLAGVAQAQDTDSLFDMNPEDLYNIKVISGTRSKRSVKDLPMTVYVITEEDIERNNYTRSL